MSKSKKICLVIGAVIVILTIIGCIGFYWSRDNKLLDYPVVFVDTDGLVVWNNEKNEKTIIDKDITKDNVNWVNVIYANKNKNLLAYIPVGNKENEHNYTLYLYNVDKNTSEKISPNVALDVLFASDDEHIVYRDNDNNIFSYNSKSKEMNKIYVANEDAKEVDKYNGVKLYSKIIDNKVFYILNYTGYYLGRYDHRSLYVYDLNNSENIKINDNISAYDEWNGLTDSGRSLGIPLGTNKSKTQMFYFTKNDDYSYSFFSYDIKDKKSDSLINNIKNIYYYSPGTVDNGNDDKIYENSNIDEFVYSVKSSNSKNMLNDDEIGIDSNTTKKQVNDKIREYNNNLQFYDVYYYKNGKSTKLAGGVLENLGVLKLLTANIDNNSVVYKTYEEGASINISELKSVDDFEEYLESKLKTYYIYNGKDAIEIENMNDIDQELAHMTIDKDNIYYHNSHYCESDGSYHCVNDNELYYLNMKNRDMSFKLIDADAYISNKYNFGITYTTDYYDYIYTLNLAKGENTSVIAYKVSNYTIEDDDNIYVLNNCFGEGLSCDYSSYTISTGELKIILTDVDYVKRLGDNKMYVGKNCSGSKYDYSNCDLYKYENDNLILIGKDVAGNPLKFIPNE